MLGQLVVGKAHNDEDDGQDSEAAELNRLASNGIDGCNCNPISGNRSLRGR